jgi:hypothetical protein
VHHQECEVKADECGPEVEFAPGFVEFSAGDFGEPEVDSGESGERDGAIQHVVKMSDHEVGVG